MWFQNSKLRMFTAKPTTIPTLRERLRLEHRAEQLQFGAAALRPFVQGSQLELTFLQQQHTTRR